MNFLIQSKTLEKLSPEIKIAVDMIKNAIKTKTPILIRHHSDADGYCAAIVLERAILPLIADTHRRERDVNFYYTRSPEKAPYYDYSDASKDVSIFLQNMTRFGYKTPLILIVDNGSSAQDLPGIKKAKM